MRCPRSGSFVLSSYLCGERPVTGEDHNMMSESGMKFTPSGRERLDSYTERFLEILEQTIREQSRLFGDKTIEVTASDVDRALEGVKLTSTRRVATRRLVLDLYAVLGIGAALAGAFWPYLEEMVAQDPVRLALLSSGLFLLAFSLVFRRLMTVVSLGQSVRTGTRFFASDFDIKHEDLSSRLFATPHFSDEDFKMSEEQVERWRKIIEMQMKARNELKNE